MAKTILVVSILFFLNTIFFSQIPLASESYNSDYTYDEGSKGALSTEDSLVAHRKITLRVYNATPVKVLNAFKKKYPEYQYLNSGDISACSHKENFIVEEVTLTDLLNELKRLYPLDGVANGKTLIVWLIDSSKKEIGNTNPKTSVTPTATDSTGNAAFNISIVQENDTQVVNTSKVDASHKKLNGHIFDNTKQLDTVYKDGLQTISILKATGAYYKPFNRLPQGAYTDPNIIDRIFNISIPLPKNVNTAQGTMPGSLRGAVTLYGNKSAYIVLDNFGYHGHSDFINPQDIESATFIKDAAGGAIWGINSGNGIIALNTKTGIPSGVEINLINSLEVGQKTDLDYLAGVSASESIELEKQAWQQYGSSLMLTPVTDILARIKNRTLSQSDGDSILASWQNNNLRKEVKDLFYQLPQRQVHGISISTGKDKFRMYASLGRDVNRLAEKGNEWKRTTVMTNLSWIGKRFEVTLNPSATIVNRTNNFITLPLNYSYLSLYDNSGNGTAIPWFYSTDLTTNAVQRGFLNWQFVPTEEARIANNSIIQTYYQVNAKLRYKIIKNVYASAFAQYGYSGYEHRNLHVLQSFFTRDLINLYRQDSVGRFSWPIPAGDILDEENVITKFQNHRRK